MKEAAFGGKPTRRDSSVRAAAGSLNKLTTLSERLRAERQRSFVGRADEISLFNRLLSDAGCSMLFLTGPVGVGKSALLRELERVATALGHRTLALDVSLLAEQPTLALPALRSQLSGFMHSGGRRAQRSVLFVDGFDRLAEEGDALFAEVEELAADVLLVVASRAVLPRTLALDPAWSRLMQQRQLAPLGPTEVETFLELREVPLEARAAIQELSHGFPLALAVAAELLNRHQQLGVDSSSLTLSGLQELHHTLARLLCPTAVSHGQQLALDVCAIAKTTTAEIVEAMRQALGVELKADAQDLFNWLSQQSFIEWSPSGLEPHLLVRLALQARLRLDRPRRFRALVQALREYSVAELASAANPGADLVNLFFLDRHTPTARRWLPADDSPSKLLEPARPSDSTQILEVVLEHEGPEAEALARRSLGRESDRFDVLRGDGIEGFLHHVSFGARGAAELDPTDPVTPLIQRFMTENPLEAEEESLLFRWFLDRRDHQAPSTRVMSVTARQTQVVLGAKQLPYSFCVFRTPSDWTPLWKDLGLTWQIVDRFQLGEHEYSLLAFMWRRRTLRDALVQAWRKPAAEETPGDPSLSYDELRVKVAERVARLAQKIKLTPREAEILELLCLGHNFEDIARQLSIRPRTVKFHQENLLRKTGVSSRVELFRKLL
jgi:DNA-binding CsgD family transcriptional regulator